MTESILPETLPESSSVFDVFVSYAHADDEAPAGAHAGWVTTFVDELKKLLRHRLGGAGATVWMDHALTANQKVTDVLAAHIQHSRTMVLFMSRGYLKSDWCQGEIGQFLRTHLATRSAESVFVVSLHQTDRSKWPARVYQLTPIEAYEVTRAGATQRLGFPNPPTTDGSAYWARLNELAHFIATHLELPPSSSTPQQEPTPKGGDGGAVDTETITPKPSSPRLAPFVWIAEPALTVAPEWESLASAIRQSGFSVKPRGRDTYPMGDAAEFRRAVEHDLAGAHILIQLLDTSLGDGIGTNQISSVALQYSIARLYAQTQPNVKYLRWRSNYGDLERAGDDDQRDMLRAATCCGMEQFRQQVLEMLNGDISAAAKHTDATKPSPFERRSDGKAKTLCVSTGPRDAALAHDLRHLIDRMGHLPATIPPLPRNDQTQNEYRSLVEGLITESDGVVLARANEDRVWFDARHFQFRRVREPLRRGLWGLLLTDAADSETARTAPNVMLRDTQHGLEAPIAEFLSALGGPV